MVVTLAPLTAPSVVAHERTALPLTCTVHAPQSAAPQPNLVPVSFSSSRITHRSGVLSSAFAETGLPLSLNETITSSFAPIFAQITAAVRAPSPNSALARALRRDFDRRRPWILRPRDADARHLRIDQVRFTFHCRLAGTAERCLELFGRARHFCLDAESPGDERHVHVRVAEIVVEEAPGLHHASAGHLLDDAAVRAAVRMVVVDDRDHRQLEPRHVPE